MSPADLVFDLIRSLEKAAVLYAGLELGIFDMVARQDGDWQASARRRGYDIEACETLLNALLASGFVHKRQGHYELADITRGVLENPFLVNNLQLAKVYTVMFRYPERVRGEYLHVLGADELKVITALGQYSASRLIDRLTALVPGLRSEPLSLLDLGCGQGYHLAALALGNPKLRCLGLDAQEEILQLARQNLDRHHLESVGLKKGDMRTFDFGNNLDIITCFTALRGMAKEEMIRLVRRVFASLKAGGFLVIHDFFLENDRTAPLDNVFFDMKLTLSAKGGQLLRRRDFEELKEVGFHKFTAAPIVGEDIAVKDSAFFIYRK